MMLRRLVPVALLVAAFGVQLAFGWGNATHVYFAKQLGVKIGVSNMNEMYGALLPDIPAYDPSADGKFLYALTHDNAIQFWSSADTRAEKTLAFGFMTHNQSWGADYTAHIKCFTFPHFVSPLDGKGGYAVEKGFELADQTVPVIKQVLLNTGMLDDATAEMFAMGIAPELGHDLAETAVDLLVKRNLDRVVGLRMVIAAQCRPGNAGTLLADAYAADLASHKGIPLDAARAFLIQAEESYRQYIIQYGTAFSLPEEQTIAMISEKLAPIAEFFIESALADNGVEGVDVTVAPAQVTQLINVALAAVKPDYFREISRTLCFIEKGLRDHGIHSSWQVFAKNSGDETEENAEQSAMPETFSLAQNSPNPFNPTTSIRYGVGVVNREGVVAARVRLAVYDLLGREVAVLVDGEQVPGSYTVQFDASGLASGVYLYRLEAGSYVETKRMTLVR